MRIETDDDNPSISGSRQIRITAIGGALIVIGSAIGWSLAAQGWTWTLGTLAVLLIVDGIDFLYVGNHRAKWRVADPHSLVALHINALELSTGMERLLEIGEK